MDHEATNQQLADAASILLESSYTVAFTGAGISVESGIPPFRGSDGLWSKYDPGILELDRFYSDPKTTWEVIAQLFYTFFQSAQPNAAHLALAEMERQGLLCETITQNIDNLHQKGGAKTVHEFHGNALRLMCIDCQTCYRPDKQLLQQLPPRCKCGQVLKPDFIFFGEVIPEKALQASMHAANNAEVFLIVGSTGEVFPAAQIPVIAKEKGAKIIEVNITTSLFTPKITDILLKGKASKVMSSLMANIKRLKKE